MKPLTLPQTICALLVLLGLFCFVSNHDFNTLYVEQRIAQGMADELNKPRETLNRMQEDAGKLLALQEVR